MNEKEGKIGFDSDLYLKNQTERILERIERIDNKLYLEFGGKLFDDLQLETNRPKALRASISRKTSLS